MNIRMTKPVPGVTFTTTLIIEHMNPHHLEGHVLTSIGVYVLSYNRPQYLREAIDSVLAQQRPADRIVVLDNGSDPGVKESISAELDKGVIWVGADHNHSSIWNHARVFELAQEDLFYLMHDDDRLLPNFLSTQVDYMERNPEVIASGCNGFRIGPEGNRDGRYVREKGGKSVERYPDSASMAELYSRSYIPFPSIVYRNGFPQKIGLEERYGQLADAVFLVLLAGQGPVVFLDEELMEYRMHASQDSKELNEDQYRMKEAFLIDCTKDHPQYSGKVVKRVRSNQTRRWMERILSAAIVHRSLKAAKLQLISSKPSRIDILTLVSIVLFPERYLRKVLDRRDRCY
ncbi:MAG TPA: glycosyltransferase family A protein [Methanomassiliicoccales archaeon]|jgi:glycosyltransferase involved in cell wall biosynthesis